MPLSTLEATRPIEPSSPAARSRWPKIQDVYCLGAVAVDDGAGGWPAAPAGHLQGVDDQLGAHVVGNRPADHGAAEDVEHRGAVDLALAGGVLGDVGDPQPVGALGDEAALHQILVHRRRRTRSAMLAPVTDAGQAGGAHQPGHPLAAAGHAESQAELGVHPRCAVGAAGGGMHLGDRGGQLFVGHLAGAGCPAAPLVEARSRHPQHPAGHRDVDAVSGELVDQPVDHSGPGKASRAK